MRTTFRRSVLFLLLLALILPAAAHAEGAETEVTPELALPFNDTDDLGAKVLSMLPGSARSAYEPTLTALTKGKILKSGSKGDAAKGLQQILADLGIEITVDGSVGKKTMAAINENAIGYLDLPADGAAINAISQSDFENLLLAVLLHTDRSAAEKVILSEDDPDIASKLAFLDAADEIRKGNNYTAKTMYEELGDYRGSAARAEKCILPWPKNGPVYRNSEYGSKKCPLIIKTGAGSEIGTYVKVYTLDTDDLVATAFLSGKGKVTLNLPAGKYLVKAGYGEHWYGPNEAFGNGPDAYYSKLEFEGSDDELELKSGYTCTLTLQIEDGNGNVGASDEDWNGF